MTLLASILDAAHSILERRAVPDGTEVTRKDGRTYKKVGAKWVYQRRGRQRAAPPPSTPAAPAAPAPVSPPLQNSPQQAPQATRPERGPVGGGATVNITPNQAQKLYIKAQEGRPTAKMNLKKINEDLKGLLGKDHGLHTLLNAFSAPGANPQIHSVITEPDSVKITLTLHDKSGNKIGHIAREIRRVNGDLHAKQDELFLKTTDGSQSTGQGLGPKIIANNFDAYERMGVKKATVDAAYVGSYVWAKMGYSATPEHTNDLNQEFQKFLKERGIKSPGFPSVNAIAKFTDSKGVKHGKDFLLRRGEGGSGWMGEVNIDHDDPGYQEINRYLGRAQT